MRPAVTVAWQRGQVWSPLSRQSCLGRRQTVGRKSTRSRHGLGVAAAAATPARAAVGGNEALLRWCIERHQLPPLAVEPGVLDAEVGVQRAGFLASREVAIGEPVLEIPNTLAITSIDVSKCPQLHTLAAGRSELVGLALWLMQERSKVSKVNACCLCGRARAFNTVSCCREKPRNGVCCCKLFHKPR